MRSFNISRQQFLWLLLMVLIAATAPPFAAAEDFPSHWLPVQMLEAEKKWDDDEPPFNDRVRLYLPRGKQPVRGVFACVVFHSADPRELADAWNFALVTIPMKQVNDLGVRSKETGKRTLGFKNKGMGLLLDYLKIAAKETGHKELATAPLVGWFGQAGSHFCHDLVQRAPHRVLAWADSFGGQLRRYPELTQKVPFALAWEVHKKDLAARKRSPNRNNVPLKDLSCQASTYGFPHGIYSKFNFFMAFLDRCIKLRLPEKMPPGEPVQLKPVDRSDGWVGDFAPISEWNPIAKVGAEEAKAMEHPSWLPDAYAAAMWRSYHSAQPEIKITAPVIPYGRRNRGPQMGLGYGGFLRAGEPLTFAAETKIALQRVEFYDGDKLLGSCKQAPWKINGVKLQPGLHAMYAVGVAADGTRQASQPAIAVAKSAQQE